MGWKRPPRLLAQRLESIKRKVVRETTGATGEVARTLDNSLRGRIKPAKRISKQDDPSGRDLRQTTARSNLTRVSWRAAADGIKINLSVIGHYTGARSDAIRSTMRYLGRERELYRTSLLVTPGKKGVRARDRIAAGNRPHRVTFAESSRLSIWAERTTKGQQELRHVVMLDRRMLEAFIMDPTIRKTRARAIRSWKRGLEQGFL